MPEVIGVFLRIEQRHESGPRLHGRLALVFGRGMLVGAALAPTLVWQDSFANRKSPRISTRFGRGPPGGVTQ